MMDDRWSEKTEAQEAAAELRQHSALFAVIWVAAHAIVICTAAPETRHQLIEGTMMALLGPAICSISLAPSFFRLWRAESWRYRHPKGYIHIPHQNCRSSCNRGLSPLELLALQAVEEPYDDRPWYWWLTWSGKTPYALRKSKNEEL